MQVQCESVISRKEPTLIMANRESIHSGHFMVSHFEAEAQDDDEIAAAVEVPEPIGQTSPNYEGVISSENSPPPLNIENSLTKLFQCMSLAYRQKLTSPKWNRFKGIRLRWKDKIRLNNVIWRCWHMQFILKQNTLVCQFASPLDVDTHNKPEAVVLEGKYWKRKLAAVTAEYKKWRMFYRNRTLGYGSRDNSDVLSEIDFMDWAMGGTPMHMLDDNDYMQFMSDTLFSTISNQPYAFPDSREIARGANLADFIQPSLGPLQPNLDDFMDTLEPLQDLLGSRLPSVPEESNEDVFRPNVNVINAEQGNYSMDLASTIMDSMQNYNQTYTTSDMEQYNIHFEAPTSQVGLMSRGNRTRTRSLMNHNSSRNRDLGIYTTMPYQSYIVPNIPPLINQNNVQQTQVQYLNSALNANMQNNLPLTSTGPSLNTIQTNMSNQTHLNNMPLGNNISNLQNNTPNMLNNISNNMMSMSSNLTNLQTLSTSLTNINQLSSNISNIPILTKNRSLGSMPINLLPQNVPTSISMSNVNNQPSPKLSPQQPFRTPSPQQNYKVSPRSYAEQNTGNIRKHTTKEMYRSNSLPLNGTLQLEDGLFLAPRSSRGRGTRANFKPPVLHSAVSDPALNKNSALLAQLLTNTNGQNTSTFLSNSNNQSSILVTPITISSQTQVLLPPSPVSEPSPPEPALSPPLSRLPRGPPRETRRAGHIHAEQKRRYNIKNGFDTLHSLIPQLHQNPTAKLSKAAMLQKGAEYIKQLQIERKSLEEEMKSLRLQSESLNTSISNCQAMLPATGAPVSRQRTGRVQELFKEHVRARTMEDYKFWIFSLLVEPLLVTFNASVSTASVQELYRTTLQWVDQHCSLVDLRPAVLNALRLLCTSTDILTNPERLPQEARMAVTRNDKTNR